MIKKINSIFYIAVGCVIAVNFGTLSNSIPSDIYLKDIMNISFAQAETDPLDYCETAVTRDEELEECAEHPGVMEGGVHEYYSCISGRSGSCQEGVYFGVYYCDGTVSALWGPSTVNCR